MTMLSSSVPKHLEPTQANALLKQSKGMLLDVRRFDEYATVHAIDARCIPLSDLERRAGELPTDCPIICICASGHRSCMAMERLQTIGFPQVMDVIGGTQAWEKAGLPVARQRVVIPLERQVRGVAGALVLIFSILGFTLSPTFHYGAAFIGLMLTATALLGICPMMTLLQLLPWNRLSTGKAA